MTLAAALLAAGRSRRMRGRDKLLEEIDGETLLRRMASRVLAAGTGPVAVTLPPGSPARAAALEGLAVTPLTVADANEGMAASLRVAGLWAAGLAVEGLLLCPADLPDLTTDDFARMAAEFARHAGPRAAPLRATAEDGTHGHPVVIPARLLADLHALTGDEGARSLLARHPPRLVALPDAHATTDLDTPEAWRHWRRHRPAPPSR